MSKDKKVYHDGEFVGVAPKKPKNKAEATRYMAKQYEKQKRVINQKLEEMTYEK